MLLPLGRIAKTRCVWLKTLIEAAEKRSEIGIASHFGGDRTVPNILQTSLGGPEL